MSSSAENFPSFNRRAYARFKIKANATIYLDENNLKLFKLLDISPTGVSGLIDYPVKIGMELGILLQSPLTDEFVKEKVKVVRCKQLDKDTWEAGLYFGEGRKIDIAKFVRI